MSETFPSPNQQAVTDQVAAHNMPPADPGAPLQHPSTLTAEEHKAVYQAGVDNWSAASPGVSLVKEPQAVEDVGELNEPGKYPWSIEGVPATSAEALRKDFEDLTAAEAKPGDPDEVIRIARGLSPENVEWQQLLASGVSQDKLQSGKVTRGELLGAGYFFLNRLGGGEKGIMDGTMPDPADPSKLIELGSRVLFTRPELEAMYEYQQSQGDGLRGEDLHAVRADMLLFLHRTLAPAPFRDRADYEKQCMPDTAENTSWLTGDPADHQVVADFFTDWAESMMASYPDTIKDLAQARTIAKKDGYIRGQLLRDVREDTVINEGGFTAAGAPVLSRPSLKAYALFERSEKLKGDSSPFLESGFVFGNNPDVMVMRPDGTGARINAVNLHLLGGHPDFPGLSEMGQADWDQRYMSTSEYVNNIYNIADDFGRTINRENIWKQDMWALDPAAWRAALTEQAQRNLIKLAYIKGRQQQAAD